MDPPDKGSPDVGQKIVVHVDADSSVAPGRSAGADAASGAPAACAPATQLEPGLTYDEALDQYVGGFGRGQLINYVLACSVWLSGDDEAIERLRPVNASPSM